MVPNCVGTYSYCQSVQNKTVANFYNLINTIPIFFMYPRANYYPDLQKVELNPASYYLSLAVTTTDTNLSKPL